MPFSPNFYNRRAGGTSKGAGSFSNVVQFSAQRESSGGPTYRGSGANEGAYLINDSGVYSVSITIGSAAAFTAAIKSGTAVDNTLADATQRAAESEADIGGGVLSVHWVGFLQEGDLVWVHNSAAPSAGVDDNQITIAQVA